MVPQLVSYDGWFYIGGSDRQNEGTYVWENGPEAGEYVVYGNWMGGSAESSQKTATGTSDDSIDAIAILGGYDYELSHVSHGDWVVSHDGSAGDYLVSEGMRGFIVEYSPYSSSRSKG